MRIKANPGGRGGRGTSWTPTRPASKCTDSMSPQYNQEFMSAELVCFSERCRTRFPITEPIYNCPKCGSLLEASYSGERTPTPLLNTLSHATPTPHPPPPHTH